MKTILSISIFLITAQFSSAQSTAEAIPVKYKAEALLVCPRIRVVEENEITIRSCRGDSTYFYIDGIKVYVNEIPDHIEEVSIIIGGLPVNYDDVNSGVIQVRQREE